MKPLFKYILVLTSLILLCCNKDERKIIITDFSKPQSFSVEPYVFYPYSMMNITINGFTNDTIKIRLGSNQSEPIMELTGKIKEKWHTDYYGEGPRTIIFDPYLATDGELEIEFSL